MPRARRPLGAVTAALLLLGALPALAGSFLDLERQVKEFTLDNGMHFLVLERRDVPVFSFNTYVDVGSVNEVQGITGIAHLLEHMAFKGTPLIGTKDHKAELKAMAAEDAAFAALREERLKGAQADSARLIELEKAFTAAKDAARAFVVPNEFGQIVENNGGAGLNASTSADATNYFYSFPSNRLEIWAYLEGSRMAQPVLREFYTEKEGPVMEERRMRTDNNPVGMLFEQFQNLAFMAHPYRHSTIGYMSDLENISRADCQRFYEANYVGNAMTVAVVGDVRYDEVVRLVKKHFGQVAGPVAREPLKTVEPPQKGEKRLVIEHTAQPFIFMGFHRGGINDPDDYVYDALADVLGRGRTSRMYETVVKKDKLAVMAGCGSSLPGTKYPNLFFVYGVPAKDVGPEQVEAALLAQIDKLVEDGVTEDELAGVKRRARADFVRGLRSNQGLARELTYYQAQTGDWRNLFRQVERIDAVTIDDLRRVAASLFRPANRTVAYIKTAEADKVAQGGLHD